MTEINAIEKTSSFPFDQTIDKITASILAAGMRVFAKIDHAANAREAGLIMPASTVFIYGKAESGTPIMIASPRSALDLPLRILVRETAEGQTIVSFHPVTPMLEALGVRSHMAARLEPAQKLLLKAIDP